MRYLDGYGLLGVKRWRVVVLALVMVMAMLPMASAGANGVVWLDFDKELVADGVWSGTVHPDGGIRTVLTDLREAGNVWHLRFDWHVFETQESPAFIADVSGVLNLKTGKVTLGGPVVDGTLTGSHVAVKAQLDLGDFSSEGTMIITP